MDDQVITMLGAWALLGLLLQGPSRAPAIAWLLEYEGKATNELMWDNRMGQLVNTRLEPESLMAAKSPRGVRVIRHESALRRWEYAQPHDGSGG